MKKVAIISSALVLAPFVAFAQDLSFFTTILTALDGLVTLAVPFVISLAILLFLWGLARYMLNQDDADARAGAEIRRAAADDGAVVAAHPGGARRRSGLAPHG